MAVRPKKTPQPKPKAAPAKKSENRGWAHYVRTGPDVFIHPAACVEGLVELGEGTSVWPGAVIRADLNHMRLGRFVNIQDNCTLHVDSRHGLEIGDYTLVGHNAMIHGAHIGRACLIGIASVILDGAVIGDGAMITAGCMIRGGKKIPPRALVLQKGGELKIVEGAAKTELTVAGSLEYRELARRWQAGHTAPFTHEDEVGLLMRAREILAELKI